MNIGRRYGCLEKLIEVVSSGVLNGLIFKGWDMLAYELTFAQTESVSRASNLVVANIMI